MIVLYPKTSLLKMDILDVKLFTKPVRNLYILTSFTIVAIFICDYYNINYGACIEAH